MPLGTQTKSAYEAWHAGIDADAEADAPWHRLVKKHLQVPRDVAGKRILEIGCGQGEHACWLATQTPPPKHIVAIDLSEAAIRKGQDRSLVRGGAAINWEVGDIQAIAHADASFDTVFSLETIEHVLRPKQALRELARVLKPGGRLFLTTPNYLGLLGLYRLYLRLRGKVFSEVGQPVNQFLLLPLTRTWVGKTGLAVLAVDGTGHYLPFPRRPPLSLPFLNHPRSLMRWFALHSLIVAEKT